MRFISSLLSSLILLLALCFAVTNRQTAVINIWPFDLEVEAPLYLLTLSPLFIGLLSGAIIMWVSLLPDRLAARRVHKELVRLHEKVSDLHHIVLPTSTPLLLSPQPSKWFFWKKRI